MTARISRTMASLVLVAGTSSASVETQDTAAQRSHPGILFRPCAENRGFECGTLRLPVDDDRPDAETFDLAVICVRARGPRIGVYFVHPGGNASGIDFVLAGAGSAVFEDLPDGLVAAYEALFEQLAHAPVESPDGRTLDDDGLRAIAETGTRMTRSSRASATTQVRGGRRRTTCRSCRLTSRGIPTCSASWTSRSGRHRFDIP